MAKYSVHQQPVETLLAWIKSGEIAIPEIQRPFVWNSSKVRDLMDSLYKGYPVGYIITWKNQDIRLKDGTLSNGKKILIDGQQRITALTAAVVGQLVLNKDYKEVQIKIAYNPTAKGDESFFEVCNTAIERDPLWVNDISPILNGQMSISQARKAYMALNQDADEDFIENKLEELKAIKNCQIGIIELDASLDIDTVTEIFIRINQKGVVLSNADFVMSKIASDEQFGGNRLRKMIDYFCHLMNDGSFDKMIKQNDQDFVKSDDYKTISWIATVNDDLYQPNYIDVLRVAYTYQFNRGKFSDLVALLSGRDFENRTNLQSIAEESYQKLGVGLTEFFNKTNYQRFINLIQSAGFINRKLISSKGSLNFAYALYLSLRSKGMDETKIQNLVKRWFVLSILTGRYSGSSESAIERDSKQILDKGIEVYLHQIEQAELDDGFWTYRIVNDLDSSSTVNNAYLCYLASQCKNNESAFLSESMSVRNLLEQSSNGNVHHIFPKNYLIKKDFKKSDYNQVANYAFTEQQINIKLGDLAPKEYMAKVVDEIKAKEIAINENKPYESEYSSIKSQDVLIDNKALNCIPESLDTSDYTHYNDFLSQRRKLMAQKIKAFYLGL
ncbi:DUF262 domain-containing protein [Acinetobacter nosocomialis]|uniref:DUF262 domain-containing protein n=1 Tax=Acinetobacter nosocomialis TaxID=106654 RepID=UPI00046133FF|nr:DUF262 domain-containing protein [Acinetobacter nosocomialis]KCX91568.1 hypothetical protein J568_3089 [Acinetobacter baumannii 6112]OTK99513.1 hypothetical protein B9X83_14880 [Acinetobacter nosocomialis]